MFQFKNDQNVLDVPVFRVFGQFLIKTKVSPIQVKIKLEIREPTQQEPPGKKQLI